MLRRLVDSFIPPTIRNFTDDIRNERIFVSVLLISAVSNLLGINIAIQIHTLVIGYLLFANAAVNIILLFLYKKGLSREIAAHIFIGQHALSFAFQAWIQGGLISPAIAAFFLLPAVAMLILGKKGAIFWFVVSALVISGYFIYESYNGAPAIKYDLAQRDYLFFSSILGTNITIFIILLVYENSKNRAIREARKKNSDLVAAQAQLIEAEKMASLGELTAGIAHEIQNPLNFVNNFSEVSSELVDEMNEEIIAGNHDYIRTIADDLRLNLGKITHHGQRASGIVKGMLEHSRTSDGKKELTEINSLADEYLRLAYHGLRAKNKSFNAEFRTDFDDSLSEIRIVPQDIGRVLLNLINNAFYAVGTKAKAKKDDTYKPEVIVSTKKIDKRVEIHIKDNGSGIPAELTDKIFQPFFTTKPTGSGTGLGLSLSYDIIKAHNGELKVESKVGEGSIFIIDIPVIF